MLLLIEFLIVAILVLVLTTLYVDEHRTRHQNAPVGRISGYWDGRERRRDIRVDKELTVRYTMEKKPHVTANSLTKNIGRGGILIETTEKLLMETLLWLEINIPDHQKPIVADGKVVWVKDGSGMDQAGKRMFNAGIKFIHMQPREKKLFLQYIESLGWEK